MPLADPYDPARLEQKLDAGADVIWTQIAYDVEGLAAWAEDAPGARRLRAGLGRWSGSCRSAAPRAPGSCDEKLPGVRVPAA